MNLYLIILSMFVGGLIVIAQPNGKYINRIFVVVLLGIATFLTAGRDINVVPDSLPYIEAYNAILTDSSFFNVANNIYGFEEGYMALALLFKKLGFSAEYFFGGVFLIESFLILKANKLLLSTSEHTAKSSIILCFWLGYYGIMYGMVVLRAGLALAIIYYAYALMKTKRTKSALVVAIIAILFHKSVFVFILAFLICKIIKVRSKKFYYGWFAVVAFIWLARVSLIFNAALSGLMRALSQVLPVFSRYAQFYLNDSMGDGFWSKKNMFLLALALLFIYVKPKVDEKYGEFLNLYMIGLTLVFTLNEFSAGYRVSDILILLSIPLEYRFLTDKNQIPRIVKSGLAIVIIVFQFIIASRIAGV